MIFCVWKTKWVTKASADNCSEQVVLIYKQQSVNKQTVTHFTFFLTLVDFSDVNSTNINIWFIICFVRFLPSLDKFYIGFKVTWDWPLSAERCYQTCIYTCVFNSSKQLVDVKRGVRRVIVCVLTYTSWRVKIELHWGRSYVTGH
jgi:hypothetical protein